MKLLLLGGSSLLFKFVKKIAFLRKLSSIHILTSPRHNSEIVLGDMPFSDAVAEISSLPDVVPISLQCIDNLDDPLFRSSVESADLIISISAAWIYRKRHIDLSGPIYQLHNTVLPLMRGGASYSWMILSGMNYAATTLFVVDEGIDTGPIVFSEKYFFPATCVKPLEYMNYATDQTIEHLQSFICAHGTQPLEAVRQSELLSSYFPRLNANLNGYVDWSWDSTNIKKFIDAFDEPYGGAISYCTRFKAKLRLKDAIHINSEHPFHPFQSGIIYRIDCHGIYIASSGNGAILLKVVLDDAGNSIIQELKLGDRFYNSSVDLDGARNSRTFFTPNG